MKKFLPWFLSLMILISLSGCFSNIKEESVKSEINNAQEEVNENQKVEESTIEESKSQDVTSKQEEISTTVNKKIVVIDPGHSSNGNREKEQQSPDSNIMKIKDPGGAQGVSTNVPEYVVAMNVAVKLKNLLEQNNVTVIMTKTQDIESPGNIERAEVGNKNNADLEIRIHCDSAENQSAHGTSMLTPAPIGYAKDISNVSKQYGQTILNCLVDATGMTNRGVVERNDLTGFNWSKVPVVLTEMGFMSNSTEDQLLNDDNYQNKLAQGLANGILEALKTN
ncbi:N-acetylmuramoyl-L-alanine amidase family protein [Clostridium uliginosum]|uniref:N-acetylmuramoyl-L-alanine amidase n=1 Tax=Clostridium uliginosum TaxID=119641 RepID=A0A1I1JTT6_9CLOT|nr:N-acetylmuramoyl-L-alanine amidase [Clostridium uliginosum]SFC51785.1 N-acetylmuramoyl-L-alanine amidase [Clostridium uliginosum]